MARGLKRLRRDDSDEEVIDISEEEQREFIDDEGVEVEKYIELSEDDEEDRVIGGSKLNGVHNDEMRKMNVKLIEKKEELRNTKKAMEILVKEIFMEYDVCTNNLYIYLDIIGTKRGQAPIQKILMNMLRVKRMLGHIHERDLKVIFKDIGVAKDLMLGLSDEQKRLLKKLKQNIINDTLERLEEHHDIKIQCVETMKHLEAIHDMDEVVFEPDFAASLSTYRNYQSAINKLETDIRLCIRDIEEREKTLSLYNTTRYEI